MNWEEKYNAIAELVDGYRRERDEAREQLYIAKTELGRWVDRETKAARERDEALARCETLRELADAAAYEQGLAQRRMMDAQRERDEARASAADQFRRGAEAMRKRCAMWIKHNSHEDGLGMGSQRIESALAALPIPEEP